MPEESKAGKTASRPSGRKVDEGRMVMIETGFSRHAEGSALIRVGQTEVLCNATIEHRVPPFLRNQGKGWITAEYGMLPRATHSRALREAAKGKQSGRTQEIQRLIGRALRACVDLEALGEITITLDCDVLNADGGTRCASVTGAWVALAVALHKMGRKDVLQAQIAAVSCGLTKSGVVLDLDYDEDSTAFADSNFVLTKAEAGKAGGIVEIQGTAEDKPFASETFLQLLALAQKGVEPLFAAQIMALEQALKK